MASSTRSSFIPLVMSWLSTISNRSFSQSVFPASLENMERTLLKEAVRLMSRSSQEVGDALLNKPWIYSYHKPPPLSKASRIRAIKRQMTFRARVIRRNEATVAEQNSLFPEAGAGEQRLSLL